MTNEALNLVTQTVDWLSYTRAWTDETLTRFATLDGQQYGITPVLGVHGDWTRDIPLHGYEDAWVAKREGMARVMISRPGHDMGIHVQLPGQALQLFDSLVHLTYALRERASVTRVDIAVDVRGVSEVEDVYKALLAGKADTKAQKFTLLTGTTGKTCYVGSRTSERYLRVYDKAAQTGTDGNWTRIELECKGRVAKWVANVLVNEGYDAIPRLIRSFVSCPSVGWYEDALTRTNAEIGKPQPKKMTDTRAWLLGTVAKTLAKETADDAEFLLEFLRETQRQRAARGADVE